MQKVKLNNVIWMMFFTVVFVAFVCVCLMHTLWVDDREHLYASYLLYKGYLPYRDFFEHHHPLMWYLFAPVFYIFSDFSLIYYAMRGFMLLTSLWSAYYIYEIGKNLLNDTRLAVCCVAVWLCFPIAFVMSCDFRPDNLMLAVFLMGMNYFLRYIQEKRRVLLQVSFFCCFISLLFLQKAVLLFFPLAMICLWLLATKTINYKDFIVALVIPVILMAIIVIELIIFGFWQDYWELNWLLNLKIGLISALSNNYFYVIWFGGVLAVWGIIKEKNLSFRLICWFYLFLLMELLFYRPLYMHYLIIYYPFLAIMIVYLLRNFRDSIWSSVLCCCVLIWFCFMAYDKIKHQRNNPVNIELMRNVYDIVSKHSDENDLIIGDNDGFIGDMRPSALGYYWFSVGHMAKKYYKHFGRRELPNYNLIMKVRKPKIIANWQWRDCSLGPIYAPNMDCPFWEEIDKVYLDEHYNNLGLIYVRKN